ncbi:MAG: hypothetical protein KDD94_03915 [Calditrichaeota bacterium]|nr:hypothetical protein [Calditrichota bacterium]
MIGQGNMSKAEHAKKVAAANAALRKRLGKYHDDIMTFSGYDHKRLYIQVRSQEEQTIKVDVIENKQFIDQLTLPYQGKYTYAFVRNGILLQVDKNDEIGPFVNVFKIED